LLKIKPKKLTSTNSNFESKPATASSFSFAIYIAFSSAFIPPYFLLTSSWVCLYISFIFYSWSHNLWALISSYFCSSTV
jgi:hypothetical protein